MKLCEGRVLNFRFASPLLPRLSDRPLDRGNLRVHPQIRNFKSETDVVFEKKRPSYFFAHLRAVCLHFVFENAASQAISAMLQRYRLHEIRNDSK